MKTCNKVAIAFQNETLNKTLPTIEVIESCTGFTKLDEGLLGSQASLKIKINDSKSENNTTLRKAQASKAM